MFSLGKININKIITIVCIIILIPFSASATSIERKKHKPISRTNTHHYEISKLFIATKWDEFYKKERKRDVDYIFGSIDGELVKSLNPIQKEQLLTKMRAIIFDQMMQDQDYFKKFFIEKYSEFFTIDEINAITGYYNTELLQMILTAKLEGYELSNIAIKDKLINSSPPDRSKIDNFTESYLYSRYFRFQDKFRAMIDKMMVDRLKELLDYTIKILPQLVMQAQDNNSTNQPQ